ncbi:cytochrome c-type biogenesis protein [Haliea sp. E17]|uniref:cytochrome c-type biogenesis protein n=1 Tax=Haliea sp. E17 TaxID=3401576 RepID=UPI003AAE67EC
MKPLVAALLMLVCLPALAVIETYDFSEPQLEQRYHALSQELRCPKCQNQNIADSNAPIAQDLRKQLFLQLEGGASDDEIRKYMVDRYGEFVRYRPRFAGATALLWLAPVLLLVLAAAVAWLSLRRRERVESGGLSANERQRLDELLRDEEQAQ